MPEARSFGRRLANRGRIALGRVTRHEFPDGESLVRVPSPAAKQAVVVQYLHQPNAKVLDTLLAADALRQARSERVVLVAPYLPYMRQDSVFEPGQPVSQKVFGKLLQVGFDAVLTVEPHLHRVQRFGEVVRGRAVSAAPAIARWLERKFPDAWIVGPDAESERWVRPVARTLRQPWMVGKKQRLDERTVRIQFPRIPRGARVVLVDDIVSSGATLVAAARALRQAGASEIHAVMVHALFDLETAKAMRAAGIQRIASCDTVPHPTNRISCVPEILQALQRVLT